MFVQFLTQANPSHQTTSQQWSLEFRASTKMRAPLHLLTLAKTIKLLLLAKPSSLVNAPDLEGHPVINISPYCFSLLSVMLGIRPRGLMAVLWWCRVKAFMSWHFLLLSCHVCRPNQTVCAFRITVCVFVSLSSFFWSSLQVCSSLFLNLSWGAVQYKGHKAKAAF